MLNRAQIGRHHPNRPKYNRIRKFTVPRIACTAERDRTDIPLSKRGGGEYRWKR
jgi:hypothetical protein